MKTYPPSWHGHLTFANIDMVAEMMREVLADETFSTVEVGRLDRPQVLTRQYLSTRPNLNGKDICVSENKARLTISTQEQNWFFEVGDTEIVYDRGRQIYFERRTFLVQIVFRLDES